MSSVKKFFSACNKGLSQAETISIAIALLIATFMITINVIYRVFFDKAFSWSDELVRYLIIYVTLIGCSGCVRRKEHIAIDKSPYLLSESLCARMFELGNSMKKLKLPKTIAKDFFTELASADRCVCDRCIGERERTAILKRADQYLGSDQQSVLNTVKSSLMDSVYDERLKKAFEELEELRAQANRLDTRFKTNEEKLIKAGGEKARELQERIEELIRLISIARDELERIESKDENDASLTEENNLHKADQKFIFCRSVRKFNAVGSWNRIPPDIRAVISLRFSEKSMIALRPKQRLKLLCQESVACIRCI